MLLPYQQSVPKMHTRERVIYFVSTMNSQVFDYGSLVLFQYKNSSLIIVIKKKADTLKTTITQSQPGIENLLLNIKVVH